MPQLDTYSYALYSALPDEPYVGLRDPQETAEGQPVVLGAAPVEWFAPRDIGGGGPTTLAVGPYQYTGILFCGDVVFAGNNPESSQEWFLTPANCPNAFLISLDSTPGSLVWTAEEPGQPIKLRPFEAGATNQVFKLVPGPTDAA